MGQERRVRPWPGIEGYALDVRLDPPGDFRVVAELELSGVGDGGFQLLLNRGLDVERAEDRAGRAVRFRQGAPTGTRFHSEGRVVRFEPDPVPADGRMLLRLTYGGEGESGEDGSDWRGILMVDHDQVRMCEQTIFYPQVPLTLDGTEIERAPARIAVDAPASFEVFVPAPLVERGRPVAGRRRWVFESSGPRILSLMAGPYRRLERDAGGVEVVTLLYGEHAALAPEFIEESARVLAFYREHFGDVGAGALGIVEIRCRPSSSYNWASEGLIVFDGAALRQGVPVRKLAHEIGHLWWGQGVVAAGAGERFLTESLAEYSAWRYLAERDPEQGAAEAVRAARRRHSAAADRGHDTALAGVGFVTQDYEALAYGKGPLVVRWLEGQHGPERVDRLLAAYLRAGSGTLESFAAAADTALGGELVMPWLDHDGGVTLALEEVGYAPGTGLVSGVVRATPEPASFPVVGRVTLRLAFAGSERELSLALEDERTSFAVAVDAAPCAVELDPGRTWPGPVPPLVVLDGARVVASVPANGGSDVPYGRERVVLEFDRALEELASDALVARMREAPDARLPGIHEARFEAGGRRLVLETGRWLPGREYRIPLRGVLVDEQGLPLLTEALAFTTRASNDVTPPRVSGSVPPTGSRVAPDLTELRITFDEPMRSGRGFPKGAILLLATEGHSFPELGDIHWEEDYRTLVLAVSDLEAGRSYALPIRDRLFRDLAGNGVEPFDLVFTVEEQR